jgi:hypothetical protein
MHYLAINLVTDYNYREEFVFAESILVEREDARKSYVQIHGVSDPDDLTRAGSRIAEWPDLDKGTYRLTVKLLDQNGRSIALAMMLIDHKKQNQISTIVVSRRP